MRNFSISARLLSCFVCIALLACLLGFLGLKAISIGSEAFLKTADADIPLLTSIAELRYSMKRTTNAIRTLLSDALSPEQRKVLYEDVDIGRKNYRAALEAVDATLQTEEQKKLLAEYKSLILIARDLTGKVMGLIKEYEQDNKKIESLREATKITVNQVEAVDSKMYPLLEKIQSLIQSDLAKQKAITTEKLLSFERIVYVAFVVVPLLAIALGILVTLSITRPLKRTKDFAEAIIQGDYASSLDVRQADEVGQLAEILREMVTQLKFKLGFASGVQHGITTPCCIGDAKGQIMFTNQSMIDLLQASGKPEDAVGLSTAEFFYGDKNRATIIQKVIAEKKPLQAAGVSVTSRKGRDTICNVDASPIYDLDNKIIAAIALVSDVTELVQAQREAEKARQDGMLHAAGKLSAVVGIVTTASDELSAQIEESTRGSEQQTQRVGEAAAAMEEMNATVMEVARNASQAAETADQAKHKAQDGARIVGDVVSGMAQVNKQASAIKVDMDALGQQAQGIGQVLNVISDIADQTNLLALNAAIEAARAGDAGRGFAVVADEVRKLAEKTMTATKEVGEAIRSIQQGTSKNIENVDRATLTIEQATKLANTSGEALRAIVQDVDQVADQVRAIATASEQQSSASEEINRNIDEVSRISAETTDAMQQSTFAVSELAEQSAILKNLIREMEESS